MSLFLQWVLFSFMIISALLIALWVSGAIYFDVCGTTKWGQLAALVWIAAVVAAFILWHPTWKPFVSLICLTGLFLVWWFGQEPSHDREWMRDVAVLPRAIRDGDTITIENARNLEYRTLEDFTPHYETRTVHLSNLHAADIILFNWGVQWMSHPVLVFDFGKDGRICVSIEVRYRKGQDYSFLRSLYRQQEMIFMVADERDIVLRRTKYGTPQEALMYRFVIDEKELRLIFSEYVDAINEIYAAPRWYHGICANCTTTFYRLPSRRHRWDWRVLANGRLDSSLYERGRLDRTLPFPELQRLAYLNDIANAAPKEGFGDYVRKEMDRRRHER